MINDKLIPPNPDDEEATQPKSSIQQVAFIDTSDPKNPTLMMAGGELCGNALRSFMYYLCLLSGGRVREATIRVLMQDKEIYVKTGVNGFQNAWAELPIRQEKLEPFGRDLADIERVDLDGITHLVVMLSEKSEFDSAGFEQTAFTLLQERNLDTTVPAAGVMFLKQEGTQLELLPAVWVRDMQTWVPESACATGTTAAGVALARASGKSVDQEIIQPSGQSIRTQITVENSIIKRAVISGPVQRITKKI